LGKLQTHKIFRRRERSNAWGGLAREHTRALLPLQSDTTQFFITLDEACSSAGDIFSINFWADAMMLGLSRIIFMDRSICDDTAK
jgi:hypothetical protein